MRFIVLVMMVACESPPVKEAAEPIFLRDGWLVPDGANEEAPPGPESIGFVAQAYTPGQKVQAEGTSWLTPLTPDCVPLGSQTLGDVGRLVSMGAGVPDTALAFSPDGRQLAVGTYLGDVLVLDGWSGEVLARRHLSETMVKQVAWSPDGKVLYAGEQSPDAFVHAMDPTTLADRWTLRLADEVETSTPPDGEDLFGVYSLPAAFGLIVTNDGSLIVAASHGWSDGDVRKNRGRVLKVSPEGEVLSRWPDTVADATFLYPRLDDSGDLLVLPVNRSSSGPAPSTLPIGGVQVLAVQDLTPVTSQVFEPLAPWFRSTYLLESLGLSGQADALWVGLSDGRIYRSSLNPSSPPAEPLNVGVPILAGEVPISAGFAYGVVGPELAIFSTAQTTIPYGAAAPELRPPQSHPKENHLLAYSSVSGEPIASRGFDVSLHGIRSVPARDEIVVGVGAAAGEASGGQFGVMVLSSPTSQDGFREVVRCSTTGPVFFRFDVTDDGRIAVTEAPYQAEDGRLVGDYKVTVYR